MTDKQYELLMAMAKLVLELSEVPKTARDIELRRELGQALVAVEDETEWSTSREE